MKAIWNGAIGFGLVNIPVQLYSATESRTLNLDMLDSRDLSTIRYERLNENTGKEVPWQNIVKGYKIDGRYVVLNDRDFEAASPEKSKILKIKQFSKESEIEPALFEVPYYIEPQKNGEDAYTLFMNALIGTQLVGIGSFILRERESLCVIRPYNKKILMLNRLRYPEEMRNYADLKIPDGKAPKTDELKMAETLIASLEKPFDPKSYRDTYHDDLLKIIHKKAKGETIKQIGLPESSHKAADLMAMLKASLEAEKSKTG